MKIGYSKYFKRFIKLIEHKSDDDWIFVPCNENGEVPFFWRDRVIKSKVKYLESDFIWVMTKENDK